MIGKWLCVCMTLVLSGCTHDYSPDWTKVHQTADAMRQEVGDLVAAATPYKDTIDALCKTLPESPTCAREAQVYDALRAAVTRSYAVIRVYEQTGLAADHVEAAITAMYAAAQTLDRDMRGLREAVSDALDSTSESPGQANPGLPAPASAPRAAAPARPGAKPAAAGAAP